MDRRDSLKTLMVASVAGAAFTAQGCKTDGTDDVVAESADNLYGRLPEEIEWDDKVNTSTFFTAHEAMSLAVLCDIILPATTSAGSATDAEVPDFIEFIVKDLPDHQLPIRGGLAWLDGIALKRFSKNFIDLSDQEQLNIIDDIAYPDPKNERPDMAVGISFFDRVRNLTLTGYYTSKMGIRDLGYKGNIPNVWDGVPADVLKEHNVDYDDEWLAKCVDQSKREVIAEWDEEGNLIT